MPKVIELQEVKKIYRSGKIAFEALRGVNISIERGETVAIMGPSGCGKSTLLNILGCMDIPTSGKYLLNGEEVSKLKDGRLSTLRAGSIGFVFQSYNLLARLSARDNVKLAMLYGDKSNANERVFKSLKQVGIERLQKNKPGEMSGGQQQRVGIARALVKDPQILLADEPTGNLDNKSGLEVIGILQRLNQEDKLTLILVTHEEEMAQHMDRIIRLSDGLVISDKPVENKNDATKYSEVTV